MSTVPVPNPGAAFHDLDDLTLLACCIWGESRGEGDDGKIAVGCVVRNRVNSGARYGRGWNGCILKPWQFSSFNANDPNSAKLLDPLKHGTEETWEACYRAAAKVYFGDTDDLSKGAVFYFSRPLIAPPNAWGDVEHTADIGGLHFYREKTNA